MGQFIRKHPFGFSLAAVYAALFAITVAINAATYDYSTGSNFSLHHWGMIGRISASMGTAFVELASRVHISLTPDVAGAIAMVIYCVCVFCVYIVIPCVLAKYISRFISVEEKSE
ncbi:MAG: hypothetical protein HFJ66_02925 [Eggerthellaceae bacterium]|nr:hypothetical protein [Eggerthellaceae bacterium]